MDYPAFIKRDDADEVPAAYVTNADEHRAQLIGWGLDVPAELVQEAADEVTKETLQAECDLRGVEYDRRWGVARLQEALAAAE